MGYHVIPPSSIVAALDWLQRSALGSIAATVAVLAVAYVGLLMLQGRFPWRKGAAVIAGCFILFSSQVISSGILSATNASSPDEVITLVEPPTFSVSVPPPVPFDPYAGASVPVPRQQSSQMLVN